MTKRAGSKVSKSAKPTGRKRGKSSPDPATEPGPSPAWERMKQREKEKTESAPLVAPGHSGYDRTGVSGRGEGWRFPGLRAGQYACAWCGCRGQWREVGKALAWFPLTPCEAHADPANAVTGVYRNEKAEVIQTKGGFLPPVEPPTPEVQGILPGWRREESAALADAED